MKIDDELIANVRRGLIHHLLLLADPEAQRKYERDVPSAFVPAELFCGWFDESYRPDDPAVKLAFSDTELAAISEFHHLFDRVGHSLPKSLPDLSRLQRTPEWIEIVEAAAHALAKIDVYDTPEFRMRKADTTNALDFVTTDDNGLSFVLMVDGIPLAQHIGAPDKAIPYWLFDGSRPPGLPLLGNQDPALRIVAVCSCGEYGCGCSSCTVRVGPATVTFEKFDGDVSPTGRNVVFVFTTADYEATTSKIAERALEYQKLHEPVRT